MSRTSAERMREWRKNNPEKSRAAIKRSNAAAKAKGVKYTRRIPLTEKEKEGARERQRQYRLRNLEKFKEKERAYAEKIKVDRAANRELRRKIKEEQARLHAAEKERKKIIWEAGRCERIDRRKKLSRENCRRNHARRMQERSTLLLNQIAHGLNLCG